MKYPPIALIVDDDAASLSYLSRRFLRNTNMGIIAAQSLGEAIRCVENKELRFDAVVTDLFFEEEKRAGADFVDGLDLIKFVNSRRGRSTPSFCVSFFADDDPYRQRADRLGLAVHRWVPKMAAGGDGDRLTAWNTVERDVLMLSLRGNKKVGLPSPSELASMEDIAEKVRSIEPKIRVTYHQFKNIDANVRTRGPIEVLCWHKEGQWFAEAAGVGLLRDSAGADIVEAIEALERNLISEFEYVSTVGKAKLDKHAAFAGERLMSLLERIQDENP